VPVGGLLFGGNPRAVAAQAYAPVAVDDALLDAGERNN
jgi:hypothetical protein